MKRTCCFFLVLLLASCAAPRSTYTVPAVVAHRGASEDAPENTLAAFRIAWEQDADAIEADFRLTADGHVVAMHDDTFERTTGVDAAVAEASIDDLRGLDAGGWMDGKWAGEPVPTLDDVLATVPPGRRVFLEIKVGPEILPALFESVGRSGLDPGQIVIICFDGQVIARAKRRRPDVDALLLSDFERGDDGVLRPTPDELIERAERLGADGVDVRADMTVLDAGFIRAFHDAGLEVHVWTVNDPDQAVRLMELDVDGITTDRPAAVKRRLRANAAG